MRQWVLDRLDAEKARRGEASDAELLRGKLDTPAGCWTRSPGPKNACSPTPAPDPPGLLRLTPPIEYGLRDKDRSEGSAMVGPSAERCRLPCWSWSIGGVRGVPGWVRRGGGDHRGCQSGEQDVEAAFEFGGAVVGGQDGGEAAQDGKFTDRQPVQAQAQQGVGFLGPFDDLLQLVEDVAVQEPEQGPVDVQGVRPSEAGAGEQFQDLLQWPQGAQWPQSKRGGQGPGDQQRHHLRVGQRQPPEVARHRP